MSNKQNISLYNFDKIIKITLEYQKPSERYFYCETTHRNWFGLFKTEKTKAGFYESYFYHRNELTSKERILDDGKYKIDTNNVVHVLASIRVDFQSDFSYKKYFQTNEELDEFYKTQIENRITNRVIKEFV